jgi:diadenylate cyclase
MERINCHLSPTMKKQLKEQLTHIGLEIQQSLQALDVEDHCLLCDFEQIRQTFTQIESAAASYY